MDHAQPVVIARHEDDLGRWRLTEQVFGNGDAVETAQGDVREHKHRLQGFDVFGGFPAIKALFHHEPAAAQKGRHRFVVGPLVIDDEQQLGGVASQLLGHRSNTNLFPVRAMAETLGVTESRRPYTGVTHCTIVDQWR